MTLALGEITLPTRNGMPLQSLLIAVSVAAAESAPTERLSLIDVFTTRPATAPPHDLAAELPLQEVVRAMSPEQRSQTLLTLRALRAESHTAARLSDIARGFMLLEDFPAAEESAKAALGLNPNDGEANEIWRFVKGRAAPDRTTSTEPISPAKPAPHEAASARRGAPPREGPRERARIMLEQTVVNDPWRAISRQGRILPVRPPAAGILSGLPPIPQAAYHASAGLGDAMTLGATKLARDNVNLLGMSGLIDTESGAYFAGEVSAIILSAARLSYAAAAKALPFFLRGATELETAKRVVEGRNSLKIAFRLGLFPNYRRHSFEDILIRYAGKPLGEIVNAGARTNKALNAHSGGIVAAATARRAMRTMTPTGAGTKEKR